MFGSSHKDAVFYGAFREQAHIAVATAGGLTGIFDDLASAERRAADIHDGRLRARELLRKTIHLLHATWITPLDRHHIHELAIGFDGVISLVDTTASRVVLFGIREARGESRALAGDVEQCCEKMRQATEILPKLSKDHASRIMGLAGEIHELEGKADERHRQALAKLFDGSTDPLTVMKWRELFDNLERATDVCRDVSTLLEAIVLENA